MRKPANKVWQRYKGFKNLVGLEPALSNEVGEILDAAAAIYLKHAQPVKYFAKPTQENARTRSERAIEEAMAQMLELAAPESARAQELEMSKGWALPLLNEMSALDKALENAASLPGVTDPLLNLREARRELESFESAREELGQGL